MGYIPTELPGFTYTGQYATELRAGWGWVIRFKSSGTLTFTDRNRKIDVFLVGGGGGGHFCDGGNNRGYGGGGGGYTAMKTGIQTTVGTAYPIVIGNGGAGGRISGPVAAKNGGTSSAFGLSAAGGEGASSYYEYPSDGANGGSGGGSGGDTESSSHMNGSAGGSNGGNGGSAGGYGGGGGSGAGVSTYEFRTAGWPLYAGGGGGGGSREGGPGAGGAGGGGRGGASFYGGSAVYGMNGQNGTANTGGGGGGAGGNWGKSGGNDGGNGGSGIVCIRNNPDDVIPVVFNGTWLTKLIYNGTEVTGLICNGTRLFMRALRRKGNRCRKRNACTWAGWKSAGC